jgi:hypothetical protein
MPVPRAGRDLHRPQPAIYEARNVPSNLVLQPWYKKIWFLWPIERADRRGEDVDRWVGSAPRGRRPRVIGIVSELPGPPNIFLPRNLVFFWRAPRLGLPETLSVKCKARSHGQWPLISSLKWSAPEGHSFWDAACASPTPFDSSPSLPAHSSSGYPSRRSFYLGWNTCCPSCACPDESDVPHTGSV